MLVCILFSSIRAHNDTLNFLAIADRLSPHCTVYKGIGVDVGVAVGAIVGVGVAVGLGRNHSRRLLIRYPWPPNGSSILVISSVPRKDSRA